MSWTVTTDVRTTDGPDRGTISFSWEVGVDDLIVYVVGPLNITSTLEDAVALDSLKAQAETHRDNVLTKRQSQDTQGTLTTSFMNQNEPAAVFLAAQ